MKETPTYDLYTSPALDIPIAYYTWFDFFEFQKNLRQYFTCLEASAGKDKDATYKRSCVDNLKTKVEEANATFLALRDKLRNITIIQHANDEDKYLKAAWTAAGVTSWHIGNLESLLFTKEWKRSLGSHSKKEGGKKPQYDIGHYSTLDFQRFEKNLRCYFSYLDELAEKNKDNACGQHLLKNMEEINKTIHEASDAFVNLKKKIGDIARIKYGDDPDKQSKVNWDAANLTSWHIGVFESMLFPENWEESFKRYSGDDD